MNNTIQYNHNNQLVNIKGVTYRAYIAEQYVDAFNDVNTSSYYKYSPIDLLFKHD